MTAIAEVEGVLLGCVMVNKGGRGEVHEDGARPVVRRGGDMQVECWCDDASSKKGWIVGGAAHVVSPPEFVGNAARSAVKLLKIQ
jgi:hypothetical protein